MLVLTGHFFIILVFCAFLSLPEDPGWDLERTYNMHYWIISGHKARPLLLQWSKFHHHYTFSIEKRILLFFLFWVVSWHFLKSLYSHSFFKIHFIIHFIKFRTRQFDVYPWTFVYAVSVEIISDLPKQIFGVCFSGLW